MPLNLSIPRSGYQGILQVFGPFVLGFEPATGWGAYTDAEKPIVAGLMRNAIVKSNGDQIVEALNLASARGWAFTNRHLKIGEALSQLFQEHFDMDNSQGYTAAILITDLAGVNPQRLLHEDLDAIFPIALLFLNKPIDFEGAIDAGLLL